jgi:glycosyltransferase involved in cell wall biosynthesis
MPLVSVVLPTHNRPQSVVRAAASVLDQSVGELELIVIDDGSALPAEQTLGKLRDERMRILRSDMPLGPARARNLGLEVATGSWIGFQDDDDEWLPGKLEKQLEVADRVDRDTGVVYCSFWREFAGGRRTLGGRRPRRASGNVLAELLRGNFVALPAALVRREAFDRIGRFDPSLPCFEDWELFIRLAEHYRFEHLDEPLLLAFDTPRSVNKSSHRLRATAVERILERHRETIAADPGVHAAFLFHIGHHLCLGDEFVRGRNLLGQSVRVRRSWRTAMTRAAATLGPGTYRALARAYARVVSED